MRKFPVLAAGLCLLAALAGLTGSAGAQSVTALYYTEVARDGRIYVFNSPEVFKEWATGGEMGKSVTLIGRGAGGETLVGENETAIDLYLFKHNLPAYDRATVAPPPSPFPKTTLSGRFYGDVTSKNLEDKGTGIKSSDSGVGIDIKRFYFTVNHDFNATWSAQFQSDIGDVGARRYDVFVKKAFLQAKLSPKAIFRLGSADTPWVPYVEKTWGQRYFDQTITDSLGFGGSAEWGLHFLGKAAADRLDYAFTIGNGQGYSRPARTKSVDFEGRVAFDPIPGLTLAVGGYSGKRGLDTDAVPAKHTAERVNALVNWVVGPVKVGGEYFTADNWNRVNQVTTDKSDGYSTWLQVSLNPQMTLFGRYDSVDPSKDLKPLLELTYYNAGFQWKPLKPLTAALAYKYAEVKGGTLGTGNGTIGSNLSGKKGTYSEIGVWVSYDF